MNAFSAKEYKMVALRDLIRAGQVLKIEVLGHVIKGANRHCSLRELGYLCSRKAGPQSRILALPVTSGGAFTNPPDFEWLKIPMIPGFLKPSETVHKTTDL